MFPIVDHGRDRLMGEQQLPRWIEWIQENIFLSMLLVAEAYLLGSVMALGWVPDIQDPATWGVYRGIGVVVFFAAGAMGAGIAVKCSLRAASAFKNHEWGFALGNLLGLFVFSAMEIWVSLAERSSNLQETPADTAVLQALNLPQAPVSPTVIMVSIFFSFVNLFYGFSSQKRVERPVESTEVLAQKQQVELMKAQHRAEMNRIRAAGIRGAIQAATQGESTIEPAANLPISEEAFATTASDAEPEITTEPMGNLALPAGESTTEPAANPGYDPQASHWILREFQAWFLDTFHWELSERRALKFLQEECEGERLRGRAGNPWGAKRVVIQRKAKAEWGAMPRSNATSEIGEIVGMATALSTAE